MKKICAMDIGLTIRLFSIIPGKKSIILFFLVTVFTMVSAQTETVPTTIESDYLEMETNSDGYTFEFRDNVRVVGSSLKVTCKQMYVNTQRRQNTIAEDEEDQKKNSFAQASFEGKIGGIGAIESIIAIGDVKIDQGEFQAVADKAEVFLDLGSGEEEARVILTGSPILKGPEGVVNGWRIILIRGYDRSDDRLIVESNPQDKDERSTIIFESTEDIEIDPFPNNDILIQP